jgi:ERF superfamily protein
MHRSSESVGAIAAALAKAQVDIINPEKSLVGVIPSSGPRELGRAFRYAPLSSGLEIARKSLGRHEIAIVQSTAIDKEAALIHLHTMLVHSSGEWMASEWPVCPVSDAGSPQRMGSALTYARRYALFALVGIAGEDDLDAPDLNVSGKPESERRVGPNGQFKRQQHVAERAKGLRRRTQIAQQPKRPLQSQLSAVLRTQLLEELTAIASAEEGVAWAQRRLEAKNTLMLPDADLVERAFREKMSLLAAPGAVANPNLDGAAQAEQPGGAGGQNSLASEDSLSAENGTTTRAAQGVALVDPESPAPFPKFVRKRDKAHREFVCSQPCLICGRRPSDAHHLRFGQPRALGRRVSDEFIVPLCRVHHRDLHRRGDEKQWWEATSIDPMEVAQRLWRETRGGDNHHGL